MKVQKPINNMTQNKAQIISSHECCMCGDYGFSYELFQCKVCQFRSQHRYCSNLYPNVAESQRICNWCLSQKDDAKEKSQNSSNSSSSFKNDAVSQDDTGDQDAKRAVKSNNPRATNQQTAMIKRQPEGAGPGRPCRLILRRHGSATMRLAGPIKKQRSIEALALPSPPPPPPPPRKRIVTAGAKEAERLRRTRSEDIVKVGITKQVFRNRVRRYKLLDEVSS